MFSNLQSLYNTIQMFIPSFTHVTIKKLTLWRIFHIDKCWGAFDTSSAALDPTYLLPLDSYRDSWRIQELTIGKHLKEYYDIWNTQGIWNLLTHHTLKPNIQISKLGYLYQYMARRMLIGGGRAMIPLDPPLAMYSYLQVVSFHGEQRNKLPSPSLPLKQNT